MPSHAPPSPPSQTVPENFNFSINRDPSRTLPPLFSGTLSTLTQATYPAHAAHSHAHPQGNYPSANSILSGLSHSHGLSRSPPRSPPQLLAPLRLPKIYHPSNHATSPIIINEDEGSVNINYASTEERNVMSSVMYGQNVPGQRADRERDVLSSNSSMVHSHSQQQQSLSALSTAAATATYRSIPSMQQSQASADTTYTFNVHPYTITSLDRESITMPTMGSHAKTALSTSTSVSIPVPQPSAGQKPVMSAYVQQMHRQSMKSDSSTMYREERTDSSSKYDSGIGETQYGAGTMFGDHTNLGTNVGTNMVKGFGDFGASSSGRNLSPPKGHPMVMTSNIFSGPVSHNMWTSNVSIGNLGMGVPYAPQQQQQQSDSGNIISGLGADMARNSALSGGNMNVGTYSYMSTPPSNITTSSSQLVTTVTPQGTIASKSITDSDGVARQKEHGIIGDPAILAKSIPPMPVTMTEQERATSNREQSGKIFEGEVKAKLDNLETKAESLDGSNQTPTVIVSSPSVAPDPTAIAPGASDSAVDKSTTSAKSTKIPTHNIITVDPNTMKNLLRNLEERFPSPHHKPLCYTSAMPSTPPLASSVPVSLPAHMPSPAQTSSALGSSASPATPLALSKEIKSGESLIPSQVDREDDRKLSTPVGQEQHVPVDSGTLVVSKEPLLTTETYKLATTPQSEACSQSGRVAMDVVEPQADQTLRKEEREEDPARGTGDIMMVCRSSFQQRDDDDEEEEAKNKSLLDERESEARILEEMLERESAENLGITDEFTVVPPTTQARSEEAMMQSTEEGRKTTTTASEKIEALILVPGQRGDAGLPSQADEMEWESCSAAATTDAAPVQNPVSTEEQTAEGYPSSSSSRGADMGEEEKTQKASAPVVGGVLAEPQGDGQAEKKESRSSSPNNVDHNRQETSHSDQKKEKEGGLGNDDHHHASTAPADVNSSNCSSSDDAAQEKKKPMAEDHNAAMPWPHKQQEQEQQMKTAQPEPAAIAVPHSITTTTTTTEPPPPLPLSADETVVVAAAGPAIVSTLLSATMTTTTTTTTQPVNNTDNNNNNNDNNNQTHFGDGSNEADPTMTTTTITTAAPISSDTLPTPTTTNDDQPPTTASRDHHDR